MAETLGYLYCRQQGYRAAEGRRRMQGKEQKTGAGTGAECRSRKSFLLLLTG
jgi:hypothetical protein